VAIARALVNRPRLLLADEPTGNLDSATSAEIVELLLALRRQLGMTVLFATHEAALAASAERIITLRDGRITK
jgi:putative ABC transport system ATP-binding protein